MYAFSKFQNTCCSNLSLITTKCTIFIHYVHLLCFSYKFWCYILHHQGEITCPLLNTTCPYARECTEQKTSKHVSMYIKYNSFCISTLGTHMYIHVPTKNVFHIWHFLESEVWAVIFLVMTRSNLLCGYQCFRGTFRLHLQ